MPFDSSNTNTTYATYVSYYFDYGRRGQPIAGPPGSPVSIVQLHGGSCIKLVNFVCQSYDEKPKPPDPDTGSDNEVLMRKAISAPYQAEMSDGTIVWTIAGVYIYQLRVMPGDYDNLTIGTPPYDASLQTVLLPNDFIKGLLGPPSTPSRSGPWGGATPSGLSSFLTGQ
ncbi:MAG TPA: hypothetical protein VN688_33390 [Gemmataceae bacterium]|nr:hypothetical protein [Gemmataceae bacterium]